MSIRNISLGEIGAAQFDMQTRSVTTTEINATDANLTGAISCASVNATGAVDCATLATTSSLFSPQVNCDNISCPLFTSGILAVPAFTPFLNTANVAYVSGKYFRMGSHMFVQMVISYDVTVAAPSDYAIRFTSTTLDALPGWPSAEVVGSGQINIGGAWSPVINVNTILPDNIIEFRCLANGAVFLTGTGIFQFVVPC